MIIRYNWFNFPGSMKGKTLSEEKARNKVFQLPVWISFPEPWFSEIDSSLSNVNLDLIIFCQALSTQYIARNSTKVGGAYFCYAPAYMTACQES